MMRRKLSSSPIMTPFIVWCNYASCSWKPANFLHALLCLALLGFLPMNGLATRKSSAVYLSCDLTPEFGGLRPVPPRPGDNGFSLKLEGLPESYEPEKTYTVTLRSTYPVTLRGFGLTAVHADNFSTPAGDFTILNRWSTKKMLSCPHVVTHSSFGKKASVQFVWTSPPSGFGCVNIRSSVVQKGSIWFRDDGDLSLKICETDGTLIKSNVAKCCSCGSARYRMTFYGLWSPETHPKDYPDFSTHWSNVIGASHNDDYSVWDYGEYATDGVKKVAEWGWPNSLEDEIRAQGRSVLDVIKTRAQWPAYQPRNIREPPSDIVDVDSGRHLVSLVTMLGPSPDWNVGITKESMCTTQCGWEAEKTFDWPLQCDLHSKGESNFYQALINVGYDLTPWDAGTDSGVSYLSPNSPINPPDKIRALTTLDDPESPFYNPAGGPIPPLARLVIERLSISGEQCGPSLVSTSSQTSEGTIANVLEPPLTSCMYAEWSEWSQCGVTCGWGIKARSKQLKIKLVPSASCEPSITEKEICKGEAQCENEDASTVCLYSDWSEWSQCTTSCGTDGLRFRTRQLQWPSEPSNCHEPLKEMMFDCNFVACEEFGSACTYSKWSDWMPCSAQCGVGQTLRKRFAIDDVANCESPVMEVSKCMASANCTHPVGFDYPTGCSYSPWTGWMPCPVTCGVGETFRKRLLDSSALNVHCDEIQMELTTCMTSQSCQNSDDIDVNRAATCKYADWSDWMPCSATCGVGLTFKKRFLTTEGRRTDCEEFQMEQAKCYMPPCNIMARQDSERPGLLSSDNKSCVYGAWSAWMPCSVTCGKGETLRKRFLVKSLDISRTCEEFQMETNRCTVPTACERGEEVASSETSEWSGCSATCGYGHRSRTVTTEKCDQIVEASCTATEYQECIIRSKCPVDCVLSGWSSWSSCGPCKSAATNLHPRAKTLRAFQSRSRNRLVKQKFGGERCGSRKERRRCICS